MLTMALPVLKPWGKRAAQMHSTHQFCTRHENEVLRSCTSDPGHLPHYKHPRVIVRTRAAIAANPTSTIKKLNGKEAE